MSDRDYDALLAAGNAAQLEKLKENERIKGAWDDMRVYEILSRIREEVDEAHDSIYGCQPAEYLRREFADVANYAHMGIAACDRMIAARDRGKEKSDAQS